VSIVADRPRLTPIGSDDSWTGPSPGAIEILRLRALPDERTVPEDEERLVAFENLADELVDAYEVARETESSLPFYERLVQPRG
jgi:hypothetical protein